MRKLTCFLLALLLLIASFSDSVAASGKQFTIIVKAILVSNNHVGEDWSIAYELNDEEYFTDKKDDVTSTYKEKPGYCDAYEIKTGRIDLVQNTDLWIKITIVEDEKYPDISTETIEHKISASDYKNGFNETVKVVVYENAGRFEGNKAVWEITFEFIP